MNKQTTIAAASAAPLLTKTDPDSPALKITDAGGIAIKAGTAFNGITFDNDTDVEYGTTFTPGKDYIVLVQPGSGAEIHSVDGNPDGPDVLGGFHFAPGGNAKVRSGGSDVPEINACSIWDRNFRPACSNPCGMALVDAPNIKPFWCDIYLLGAHHDAVGTSRFGVMIADGDDLPVDPSTSGKRFKRFDYAAAIAVMASHGKALLSFEEFAAAAYGVTEKTATKGDPEKTGLDAPRTSKFGIMQATGNMWVWGHDGDPDEPRASIFGGGWFNGDDAGSRCAGVACCWPVHSSGRIGARGRSDHLQLA